MSGAGSILVTGGSGRLGQALARQGCTALSRARMDITQPEQLAAALDDFRPAAVINAAAYTAVDAAEENEAAARAINADGAGHIAACCAAAGIPLIHISTDMVFSAGDPDHPLDEAARPSPNSVYGATKLEGELAVQAAGGRHVIARVSWLFDRTGTSFISKMLEIAADRPVLKVVTDETGRPTDTDALAAHLVQLARHLIEAIEIPSLLHLGPGPAVSRFDWARRVFETSARAGGPRPELEPVTSDTFQTAAERPRGVVLDIRRADALLGPLPDWQASSDEAVRAHLAGPPSAPKGSR